MADQSNNQEPPLLLHNGPSNNVIPLQSRRGTRLKRETRLAEAVGLLATPARSEDLAFLNSVMVQATFPYREPKGNPPSYVRQAGRATLYMQPLMKRDPKDPLKMVTAYPYGPKPRLLMAYLGKQVLVQRSRELELGRNLTSFMAAMGFEDATGGKQGSITLLTEQARRLFGARIALKFEETTARGTVFDEQFMQISDGMRGHLWWSPKAHPSQENLAFEGECQLTVTLSERFYQAMLEHQVPLDMRILRALKGSALELDWYAFLSYRYRTLNRRTTLSWDALHSQFGTGDVNVRKFKLNTKRALANVKRFYVDANFELADEGVTLLPSPTSVPLKVATF